MGFPQSAKVDKLIVVRETKFVNVVEGKKGKGIVPCPFSIAD
jgi:hypothetical protein